MNNSRDRLDHIGMDAMEELRKRLPQIRTPLGGEKVYKDECAFSFDNPVSDLICRSNLCQGC